MFGKIFGFLAAAGLTLAPMAAGAQTPRPSQVVKPAKGFDFERDRATRLSNRFRPSGNPPQVSEAKALAKSLNVSCQVIDAAPIAKRDIKGADGAVVRIISHEIACKDDFGWIISQQSDGLSETFNCMALDASAAAAGKANWSPEAACLLPANGSQQPGLRALAAKAASGCEVETGAFLGQGGQPPILRFELLCQDGGGYLVDTPAPGSSAAFATIPCAEAAKAGMPCSLAARPGASKRKPG